MSQDLTFLRSSGLSKDEVVFLSCIDLKKRLMETDLTLREVQRVKKIRKRERSKALDERENHELEGKLISLSNEKNELINEQRQLRKEVELYKIKIFLNSTGQYEAEQAPNRFQNLH